jgi:enoyl-CoA hydratase
MGIDPPAFIAAVQAGIIPVKDPDFISILELTPQIRAKPLVVAVQGGTQFAGHEYFLAADIRVAASDTVFRQAEVTRGSFPGGKQLDVAIELAKKVAAVAPLGVRATLASSRQALAAEETTALAAVQPTFSRLQQTEDFKEFQRALREGRAPVFRGI